MSCLTRSKLRIKPSSKVCLQVRCWSISIFASRQILVDEDAITKAAAAEVHSDSGKKSAEADSYA